MNSVNENYGTDSLYGNNNDKKTTGPPSEFVRKIYYALRTFDTLIAAFLTLSAIILVMSLVIVIVGGILSKVLGGVFLLISGISTAIALFGHLVFLIILFIVGKKYGLKTPSSPDIIYPSLDSLRSLNKLNSDVEYELTGVRNTSYGKSAWNGVIKIVVLIFCSVVVVILIGIIGFTGISAAGITSALATIGSLVGGGMLMGIVLLCVGFFLGASFIIKAITKIVSQSTFDKERRKTYLRLKENRERLKNLIERENGQENFGGSVSQNNENDFSGSTRPYPVIVSISDFGASNQNGQYNESKKSRNHAISQYHLALATIMDKVINDLEVDMGIGINEAF